MLSTDNGAASNSWPDGGNQPFQGVGAVAVSWLIALLALVVGGLLTFVARRRRRVQPRREALAS